MSKKMRNNLRLHQPIEDSFSAYSVPSEMSVKIWIKDAVKVSAAAALIRLLTDFTFLTSSHV